MKKHSSAEAIGTKAAELICHKLFHPYKEDAEIVQLSEEFSDLWPQWIAANNLEHDVNTWLKKLKLSHTGFWHGPGSGMPPYFALNAVLKRFEDGRFVFWDILPNGVAERCGIRAGDVLLAIEDQEMDGVEPRFRLGDNYQLILLRGGVETVANVLLPKLGPKDRPPMIEASPLSYRMMDRTGILRVTSFPGAIGFGLLSQLKSALSTFAEKKCNSLVLDLRSNCGGGLSSVRLMGLLVPDRRLIGYSLTRRGRDRKMQADALPAIRHLPSRKLGMLPLALRFRVLNRDRSFRLFTEGLGKMPFHGRVAVLVNEHTRSAAEMVAAFAQNEGVAHVLGTRTPGEVLGAANFHVGGDYRLRMPVTAWYTANGKLIEGEGIAPEHEYAATIENLLTGKDMAMEAALSVVR